MAAAGARPVKAPGKQAPNWAWRHYWRDNRLAACVPDNPASAAAIEAHWTAFFADLPAGTRVLDIATGNGVVLVWAARAARQVQRELVLTGIDFADIDPARFLPEHQADLAAARFVGNTPAESLPVADASFDVVVSQYGLEYADLTQALAEAARVLVPGGQLHWLAHGEDSIVVAQGRAQLEQLDLLLAAKGPFAAMESYIEARLRSRKVNRATRELTEVLRAAESYCTANPAAMLVRQICGAILETANRWDRYRPAELEHWLDENRKRMRGHRQRIRDLQAARLTGERLETVEQTLRAAPWSDAAITSLEVGAASDSVGRLVRAVKH